MRWDDDGNGGKMITEVYPKSCLHQRKSCISFYFINFSAPKLKEFPHIHFCSVILLMTQKSGRYICYFSVLSLPNLGLNFGVCGSIFLQFCGLRSFSRAFGSVLSFCLRDLLGFVLAFCLAVEKIQGKSKKRGR